MRAVGREDTLPMDQKINKKAMGNLMAFLVLLFGF